MNPQIKHNLLKSLGDHARSLQLQMPQSSPVVEKKAFVTAACNISLDYTNQHITRQTLDLLIMLADQCCLRDRIKALMRGDNVNMSEQKPALHTALRANGDTPIWVDGQNVMTDIIATRHAMQRIVEQT